MERSNSKINVKALIFLLTAAYTVSYITRINFGAVISEIESATRISRELLSMSVTGSFITYGAGQIISGILGDRLSPKKLVAFGFATTTLMNFLIPLCKSPYLMLFVWCINGFAQSFMWPPLVKIMTALLSDDDYKIASVRISYGSSIGTVAVYLISPLAILLCGWKGVFVFSAICGALMLLFWGRFAPEVDVKSGEKTEKTKKNTKNIFTPVVIAIMVAIIFMGMLRDGVTTWMPSYVAQTYNLSNIISILTGVVLPIFSMVCFKVASYVYRKKLKNPVLCAGAVFLIGAISSVFLLFATGKNAALSVVFSALLTGSMHGVNLMLICMLPPFFKGSGQASTVSGILNSFVYIGSAISTYGIALISKNFGWQSTLLIWAAVAALGTLICFASAKAWQKHTKNGEYV